jgi:hypothetical protein
VRVRAPPAHLRLAAALVRGRQDLLQAARGKEWARQWREGRERGWRGWHGAPPARRAEKERRAQSPANEHAGAGGQRARAAQAAPRETASPDALAAQVDSHGGRGEGDGWGGAAGFALRRRRARRRARRCALRQPKTSFPPAPPSRTPRAAHRAPPDGATTQARPPARAGHAHRRGWRRTRFVLSAGRAASTPRYRAPLTALAPPRRPPTAHPQTPDAKKEEFRKYLEKAGVVDALTKGERPADSHAPTPAAAAPAATVARSGDAADAARRPARASPPPCLPPQSWWACTRSRSGR